MYKVKILSEGRTKEPWLVAALVEYEKRLSPFLQIEWQFTDHLLEASQKEPFLIALDLWGELLSSEEFSQKLSKLWIESKSRLTFIIGGAEGLPPSLKPRWRWSLSPLTFTHQMTRLLLLEQLYRALQIEKGTQYHK